MIFVAFFMSSGARKGMTILQKLRNLPCGVTRSAEPQRRSPQGNPAAVQGEGTHG